MKKVFLLGCILLSGSLCLAATTAPTVPSASPSPATSQTAIKADTSLEGIARNIDRRIAYFNRYKQSNDTESIKKLISEQNKDFYTNFIKYVEASPVFTLKRDTAQRIVKTPLDEYILSVLVSLNGKETRVSMTFVEEKSEQGNKWLIADSNLHVQIPLPTTSTPTKGSNLASSAVKKPTTPSQTTTSTDQKTVSQTKSSLPSSIATIPVVSGEKTVSNTAPVAKTAVPAKSPTGSNIIIVVIIALLCVIAIASVVFFLIRKKHKALAALSTITAATTVAATVSEPETTPVTTIPPQDVPLPTQSNVAISTVEEVQNPVIIEEAIVPSAEINAEPEEQLIPLESSPIVEEVSNMPVLKEESTPIATTETASSPVNEEIVTPFPAVSAVVEPVAVSENILDTEPSAAMEEPSVALPEENMPAQEEILPTTTVTTATDERIPQDTTPKEVQSLEEIMNNSTPVAAPEEPEPVSVVVPAAPVGEIAPPHPLFENILNSEDPKTV